MISSIKLAESEIILCETNEFQALWLVAAAIFFGLLGGAYILKPPRAESPATMETERAVVRASTPARMVRAAATRAGARAGAALF